MIMPMSLWPIKKVWHYPDGRKELRLNGAVLPYSTYDRLQEIDQGAILDNKRLERTLEFIKLVQDKHFVLTAYPMG